MSKATIADLAKYCGVSKTTVSLVLTNKGRISKQTRDKVLDAIDEIGYVYNQTAANLRNERKNLIGMLIHDLSNPVYADMIAGLNQSVESQNSLLFLANGQDNLQKQNQFIQSLLGQNASGLILCPARGTSLDYLRTLEKRGLSVVCAGRRIDGDGDVDFVGTDDVGGARLATDFLLKKGHSHIAFIGGLPQSQVRSLRLSGYVSKLFEAGIPFREEYVVSCNASRIDGARETKSLLARHPEITAILSYHDIVAFGVISAISELGLKVGKDVSVIGYDNVPEASDSFPPLTTVSISAKEIGKTAGELVFSRMQGDKSPYKKIILAPKLIIRDSTGGLTKK